MELEQNREKLLLLSCLFTGYMMIVFVRESVAYSAPVIANAERFKDTDLGLIISSQKLGYTLVKFWGGILADMFDPRVLFTTSLVLSGISGASFATCSTIGSFSLIWFLCGVVQGPAWTACALLLRRNVLPNQFATWWSVLSTSSNVAGTLGPFVSQFLNRRYPWRLGFLCAGALSVMAGILCGFFFVIFRQIKGTENLDKGEEKKSKVSKLSGIRELVNSDLLTMCGAYFLLSLVRGAFRDWSQHYLIHGKKQAAIVASEFMSCHEIGGVVGSIVAGYLSDLGMSKLEHRAMPRIKCLCLFSTLLTVGVFCLCFLVDDQSFQIWILAVSFAIGFCLSGCITLAGVIAMDLAPSHLAGTSHSIATLASNVARVVAGYPLALISTHVSWHATFITALMVSLMAAGTSVLLRHLVHTKHSMTPLKKDD